MTTTPSPPSGGAFVVPSWWTTPEFTLTDIATFLETPISTVSLWVTFARTAGFAVGQDVGRRARYSCHDVFPLAMLAKLRRRIPIAAPLVAEAFAFARQNDQPRPIRYDECWVVFEDDETVLRAPAWLCWTAARALGAKVFGSSHA